MSTGICRIAKKEYPIGELTPFNSIRKQLIDLIRKDAPDFSEKDFICHQELNSYRSKYLENLLKKERKQLNKLVVDEV